MEKTEFCVFMEKPKSPWKEDHFHYKSIDESLWLILMKETEGGWIVSRGVCTQLIVPLQP